MWNVLGIEPTVDVKSIKKSYAKMLTIYHPEDYPEEFQRLQMAYQSAIRYAKENKYENEVIEDIKSEIMEDENSVIQEEVEEVEEVEEPQIEELQEEELQEEELQEEELQEELIPEYIQQVKNVDLNQMEHRNKSNLEEIVRKIRSAIYSKNRNDVKDCLAYLEQRSFREIAIHPYVLSRLRNVVADFSQGNTVILHKLEEIYKSLDVISDGTGGSDIVEVARLKKISLKLKKKNKIKNRAPVMLVLAIIFFVSILMISDMYIVRRNEAILRAKNKEIFCTLVKERYDIEVKKKDIYVEFWNRDYIQTVSDEKLRKVYYNVRYTTLDEHSFLYGTVCNQGGDITEESLFNLEREIFTTYGYHYFEEYLYRSTERSVKSSGFFSDVIFDVNEFNIRLDVTQNQFDTLIEAIKRFNEVYWSEKPVATRNSKYIFTIHLYDENQGLHMIEGSALAQNIEIVLSAKDHKIDEKELKETCDKFWKSQREWKSQFN